MNRFEIENTLEGNYLNVRIAAEDTVDFISVNVLSSDSPEFLVPFKVVDINNQMIIRYKLKNLVALQYSNMSFTHEVFIRMYRALLTPFVEGKDWFLDYHNICINESYVYLSRDYTKAYYLYFPCEQLRNAEDSIFSFFQNILNKVNITDDSKFLVRLYQYFNSGNVTLSDLYQMVLEECKLLVSNEASKEQAPVLPQMNMSPEPYVPAAPVMQNESIERFQQDSVGMGQKGKVSGIKKNFWGLDKDKKEGKSKKKDNHQIQQSVNVGESDVMQALFGEKEKKSAAVEVHKGQMKKGGLFKKKVVQEASIMENESDQQPIIQSTSEMYSTLISGVQPDLSDATQIFDDEQQVSKARLELVDTGIAGAPVRIDLPTDKSFVSIGRLSHDVTRPDIIFDASLKAIGRMHARIEMREGDYYVIDLGSANHTALDGQILVPNQPYRLCNGSELIFAPGKPIRYRVFL